MARAETTTGGREATTAVIPGRFVLSVGFPNLRAPDRWKWTPLSSVARLESGHTPSRKNPEYWGGDIPWLGIRDATKNHGRTIHETAEYTNKLGIANSSARILPKDTVCLSRTASVGYIVVMGREMATSQDFVNWVCSENLNPHFLKYALLVERSALEIFAVGSVHQTIYFPEVKAFHLCMPSRMEQDEIVGILKSIDDKIEINDQQNEVLTEIASAIFKDWFIDFGPTRAKMAKQAPYLAPDIWSLFPDELDDNGQPAGWSQSPIGDEIDVAGGSTPSTTIPEYWGGDIAWVTPKDLSPLTAPVLLSTERRITAAGLTQIGSGLLPVGTVLLSSRAPIGYLAVTKIPCAINQGFIAMRCNKRVSKHFAWLWTNAHMDAIKQKANGSTFQEISKSSFRTIPILLPNDALLSAFEAVIAPLLDQIVSNEEESRGLAETRDFLLPKLMSGELRVDNSV